VNWFRIRRIALLVCFVVVLAWAADQRKHWVGLSAMVVYSFVISWQSVRKYWGLWWGIIQAELKR